MELLEAYAQFADRLFRWLRDLGFDDVDMSIERHKEYERDGVKVFGPVIIVTGSHKYSHALSNGLSNPMRIVKNGTYAITVNADWLTDPTLDLDKACRKVGSDMLNAFIKAIKETHGESAKLEERTKTYLQKFVDGLEAVQSKMQRASPFAEKLRQLNNDEMKNVFNNEVPKMNSAEWAQYDDAYSDLEYKMLLDPRVRMEHKLLFDDRKEKPKPKIDDVDMTTYASVMHIIYCKGDKTKQTPLQYQRMSDKGREWVRRWANPYPPTGDHQIAYAYAVEYVNECEHQDGEGYWENFATVNEADEDFLLYMECITED